MKKTSIILSVALSMLLSACGNQQSGSERGTEAAKEQNEEKLEDTNIEKDAEFAVQAASGGMMEVQLGKLAQTKAASDEVKKFGQLMADDHAKANEELMALAKQKNITLPTALTGKHQDHYTDLSEKSGAEFDQAYMDLMVKDHEEDINLFEKQAENGNDPELKSWAAGKVTTLRHHHEMAKATKEVINNTRK